MRIALSIFVFLLAGCSTVDTAVRQDKPVTPRPALPALDNDWYAAAQDELADALGRRGRPHRARNVILFIGDGMSLATITAARILEGQLRGEPGEENALSFERFPHVALAKVYNTNAQVPDSAGTATAMLSGVKTIMGVLGADAGVVRGDCSTLAAASVPTLLEHAERAGLATGIVSTARITHATPASSYAHTPNRDWEDAAEGGCEDIASQLIGFAHGDGPDVVLGGGRSYFLPSSTADPEYPDQAGTRLDGRDLVAEWLARFGGEYVWNKAQFDAVNPHRTRRLLGLFEPSHMQFEADREDGPGGEPSLAGMVRTAVQMLEQNENGYFLFVEGARIDHAHHTGNAYRALYDTIAMSDAVAAARELASADDTLIIVTADHGHVMEIAGYPRRGNPILGKVVSLNPDGTPATDYAVDAGGLPYTTLVYGNGPGHLAASDTQPEGPKTFPHFAQQIGDTTRGRSDLTHIDTQRPDYLQESAVPTLYETHSGTDVTIYADGPGASLFQGVHEQHYIYHVMAHALFTAP